MGQHRTLTSRNRARLRTQDNRTDEAAPAATRLRGLLLASSALITAAACLVPGGPAQAGTCNPPVGGPPFTIPGQTDTVELDTDCMGMSGGAVTVTGDVTSDGGSNDVIADLTGNQQNWAVTINPGVTVSDGANNNIGLRFNSPGASLDNAGTVDVQNSGVLFIAASPDGVVVNRAGATIQSGSNRVIQALAGAHITNAGTLTGPSDFFVTSVQNGAASIVNSGTITGALDRFSSRRRIPY